MSRELTFIVQTKVHFHNGVYLTLAAATSGNATRPNQNAPLTSITLDEMLAAQLNVQVGDELTLFCEKAGF